MNALRENPGSGEGSQPSTTTSRSLLERVRSDEPAAWDRLVALYAPLVLGWCRGWGLREQDAADIFQEVFQAVAAHISGFRKEREGDTFRGWLRTITRNKVHDFFRLRNRQPEGVGGSEAQDRLVQLPAPQPCEDSSHLEENGERGLVARALELIRCEFTERTWQAFWRTAIEGRSAPDVAGELSMSAGAVRVAKSRVLQRLREELGDVIE
ncbi:MAG TPA: sigma-70 family RNA polymerase sigma factor [Gemmataceae bacterium]|jgi:RNA polymerase sigma-70 factor (ECF subfamily)